MKIKNLIHYTIVITVIWFTGKPLYSQDQVRLDSLKSVLYSNIADTVKAETLNEIAMCFWPKQMDSVRFYAQKMRKHCQEVNYFYGEVKAIKRIASIHLFQGDLAEPLKLYDEAKEVLKGKDAELDLIISLEVNDGIILNSAKNYEESLKKLLPLLKYIERKELNEKNTRLIYRYLAHNNLALENYQKAIYYYRNAANTRTEMELKVKELNDYAREFYRRHHFLETIEILLPVLDLIEREELSLVEEFRAFALIGGSYQSLAEYKKALTYFEKTLEYLKSTNNQKLLIKYTIGIGKFHAILRNYDGAKKTLSEALKIINETKIDEEKIDALTSLGYAYFDSHSYDSAIIYFRENLKLSKEKGNDYLIAQAYSSLGETFIKLNELEKARLFFQKAVKLYKVLDESQLEISEIGRNYLSLYTIDTLQHIYTANTFLYHKKFQAYRELTIIQKQKDKIAALELAHETEKKNKQIQLLKAENDLQKANYERQRNLKFVLVSGSILLLLLLGISASRYNVKKKAVKVINEQKKAVEEKNHENELLIQEIHHRVKNNLQVILSLLNAQKNGAKGNQKALDVIVESQNKIRSMALIHENLYNSDSLSKIATASYFKGLIDHIKKSYSDIDKKIDIKSTIDNDDIKMSLAVLLGLIVNELVTNAYKYAFQDHENDNMVTINFIKEDEVNTYKLEVFDNGPGLPTSFDLDTKKTFGWQMIRGLTEQVNGKIVTRLGKGAGFDIYVQDNGIEKVA